MRSERFSRLLRTLGPRHRRDTLLAAVSRLLGRPLRRTGAELGGTAAPADAIVVLGAPLTRDGRLTAVLEERAAGAVRLWRAGAAPVVCVTGGGPPGRVEADAVAARLVELGLPESQLRLERHSRTTAENAAGAAAILEGCRTVWLVTQPFHTRRAARLFDRAGFEPRCVHIGDSVQYRDPRRALRWIAREYAAWARALTVR